MARLFDADPEGTVRVSIPLLKFEDADDGTVYVWGKATDGTLDRDEQIIDPDFAAKSLRDWFETGANVRTMHSSSLYPAGKGVELVSKDGGQWLKSHIVEPTAVRLVKGGALTAYSVGIARPRIIRDAVAKGGRVVGGETVEVSLVDRPANPSCGVVLAKMAGGSLELTNEFLGHAPGPSPATLAAALVKNGHAKGAVTADGTKRDMDPDVGGGVDRDQLGASDFVFGDERAFPIVTPGDVPDAVSSWGRYKGAKSFDAFKSALTELARRKGPQFAEQLPKEWTKKVIVGAGLAKGSMDCKGCGASYDADTASKFCGGCGKKLKKAKVAKGASAKAKAPATDPDGDVDDKLGRLKDAVRDAVGAQAKDPDGDTDPHDAKVSAHLEAAEHAVNSAQTAQTKDMAGDDAAAEKGATLPAPVEGMGYGLRRLHDAVCGAYQWAAVKGAHPVLATAGLAGTVTGAAQLLRMTLNQSFGDDLAAADAERLASLSKAYAAALGLAAADEATIAEARAELVKDFRTANPDAPALTPLGGLQNPDAGRWRRPYISAGHANQSAAPGQHPRIPDASHVPDASQFTRPLITSGHQAEPPANSGGSVRPVATSDGPGRVQPRMAPGEGGVTKSADSAAAAMQMMHDHIADAFPGCCPMAPAQSPQEYQGLAHEGGGPDMRAGSVPKTASASAALAKAAMTDPDLFKAAVAAVVGEVVQAREDELRADYEGKIADLTATHNAAVTDLTAKYHELAGQPDPRMDAFRGMAGIEQNLAKHSQEPPAAATDKRAEFYRDWLDSPDPAYREVARDLLRRVGAGS